MIDFRLELAHFADVLGLHPQLSNNNANIRRIKARIQELEKLAQRKDKEEGNDYI